MIAALSQGTLQRLPQYLIMLKSEAQEGHTAVTADDIGQVVKVGPSQVRHDLSSCGANVPPERAMTSKSSWDRSSMLWAMTISQTP